MTPADEAFLLTLAGLLRAGILTDPVPAYRPQDLPIRGGLHAQG